MADRADYYHKLEYHGEIVTSETNKAQCIADGGTVCDPTTVRADIPFLVTRPVYSMLQNNAIFFVFPACQKQHQQFFPLYS